MPACPNCACQLPRFENIRLSFRSRTCPECNVRLKRDLDQFALENFLILIIYSVLSASTSDGGGLLVITQTLSFTHEQIIYGFPAVWGIIEFLLVFFTGKLVQVQPQPSFRQQLKQMLTYEPTFPDFKFKRAWFFPIVFFAGLVGVIVLLVIVSNKIAG